MANEIKTTHHDITITYQEHSNNWTCDLFTKPAESLEAAKKRIDTHLDKVKKKPFKRFAAYVRKYGKWVTAEITSIAEDGKSAQATAGRERMKIDWQHNNDPDIYPVNAANTMLFNAIAANKKEMDRLQDEIYKAEHKMTRWAPES